MMTTSTAGNLTRYLRHMLRNSEHEERTDAELLALFVRDKDEQAFATLVRRFSVLVWGACYRILGHREEAEDAFQATFLVLARKADQIRRKEVVGHWLYEVAQRTAQDVRKSLARRHRHEKQASTMLPTAYKDDVDRPDLLAVLDEGIVQLPETYRLPLILCRLEGHTYAEAGRSLDCSTAAVGRRVARAEELLRDRLSRRGVALAGVSVATLLSQVVTAKGMPVDLVGDTIRAAQAFASGTLAPNLAGSIAQGVMQSMASSKTVLWGAVLVTLIGAAVGLVAQFAPKAQGLVPPGASAAPPAPSEESRQDRYGDPLPPGALARLGTVRWRQTFGFFRMAFTRDGKGLVTAGTMDPARLWDAASGRMLRQFDDWGERSGFVAFSSDGRLVAGNVRSSGELGLWDMATGKLIRRWTGRQAGANWPLALLGMARELCEYGQHLSGRFVNPGDPPFEDQYLAIGLYLAILAGDNVEEGLDYFRKQAEQADPETVGTYPAQVLVNLLLKLDRPPEALAVARKYLAGVDNRQISCPSVVELCQKVGDFRTLAEVAREQGNAVHFLAGLLASAQGYSLVEAGGDREGQEPPRGGC